MVLRLREAVGLIRLTGYCFVGDPEDLEIVPMDTLRSGDLFRFVAGADAEALLEAPITAHTAASMVASVQDAQIYVYRTPDVDNEWPGAGCCRAEPLGG